MKFVDVQVGTTGLRVVCRSMPTSGYGVVAREQVAMRGVVHLSKEDSDPTAPAHFPHLPPKRWGRLFS